MSSIVRIALFGVLSLCFAVGCHRKPLYDECICNSTGTIPVSLDWSWSGVNPQNVTILVYDSESGELVKENYYQHNDNYIQSYISLGVGIYDVVIFNELRNEIDYVRISEYDPLSAFEFYVTDSDSSANKVKSDDSDIIINEPGDLALIVVRDLAITEAMIEDATVSTYEQINSISDSKSASYITEELMGLVPELKCSTMEVVVEVKRITTIASVTSTISGISQGYKVDTDKNNMNPRTMELSLGNATLTNTSKVDGDENEETIYTGTIDDKLQLFGALGDRRSTSDQPDDTPILLTLHFVLADQESTEVDFEFDITDIMEYSETLGKIYISAQVSVELPYVETDPDDPDDPDEDTGFGSNLSDWDGNDVEIIL